jgi:hypothetical protein
VRAQPFAGGLGRFQKTRAQAIEPNGRIQLGRVEFESMGRDLFPEA